MRASEVVALERHGLTERWTSARFAETWPAPLPICRGLRRARCASLRVIRDLRHPGLRDPSYSREAVDTTDKLVLPSKADHQKDGAQ
jgi:hypothetical protein